MAYRAQFVPGSTGQENLERAQRAISTFETVIELENNPGSDNSINGMAHIAGIYQGLNEFDQAKEWYRKRIEVDQKNPDPPLRNCRDRLAALLRQDRDDR